MWAKALLSFQVRTSFLTKAWQFKTLRQIRSYQMRLFLGVLTKLSRISEANNLKLFRILVFLMFVVNEPQLCDGYRIVGFSSTHVGQVRTEAWQFKSFRQNCWHGNAAYSWSSWQNPPEPRTRRIFKRPGFESYKHCKKLSHKKGYLARGRVFPRLAQPDMHVMPQGWQFKSL